MSFRLAAPPRSSPLEGWKERTHLILVTSRSPTAYMPEIGPECSDGRRQGRPTSCTLPEGEFILKLNFLREKDDDWVLEDKFDPVRDERKKDQGVTEISRETKPEVLTGIDSVFFQNAYPVLRWPMTSTPSEIQIPPIWLR